MRKPKDFRIIISGLLVSVCVGNVFGCFLNNLLECRVINLVLKHAVEQIAVNGEVNRLAEPA